MIILCHFAYILLIDTSPREATTDASNSCYIDVNFPVADIGTNGNYVFITRSNECGCDRYQHPLVGEQLQRNIQPLQRQQHFYLGADNADHAQRHRQRHSDD